MRSVRLAICLMLAAWPAAADLSRERGIAEGLVIVGIAYEISEVCPDIDARRLRGLRYLLALQGAARDMGYSQAEIDAYIDDDTEKDRLEAIARDRLARMGAARGDVAAHCAVGRREVAGDTQVGRLLSPR